MKHFVAIIFISAVFFQVDDRASAVVLPPLRVADRERMKQDVLRLVSTSVPRNSSQAAGLAEAAHYIQSQWQHSGYKVTEQSFMANGQVYKNLLTSMGPEDGPRLVIGAHYDVADLLPGADDNASGVAGLLEVSRILKERQPKLKHRIDLVAYTLEEPPFFATAQMGSAVHAKSLKQDRVDVKLMLSLEMIGYYREDEGSQKFPLSALGWVYPKTGNFIAVIGEWTSPLLVRKVTELMREHGKTKAEGLAAPKSLVGIDFSDHRSFWNEGYPALMITDTAFFRNPNYHEATDTPETLNYQKMSEVVEGLYGVVTQF